MIIFLFISVLMLIAICFIFFKFDFASPSLLLIIPYFISIGILAINQNEWQVSISHITFAVVFFGLLLTFVGEVYARITVSLLSKEGGKKNINQFDLRPLQPKNSFANAAIIYMVLSLGYYSFYVLAVVNPSEIAGPVLGEFRSAEKDAGIIQKIFFVVHLPLAYFFLMSFVENYLANGVVRWKLFIPVVLYAFLSILTSARIGFLYLFVVALVIWFIVYQRKRMWRLSFNPKASANVVFGISFVLVFFYVLGFLTGKSNAHNIGYIIALYIGSSVAALDSFLYGFQYDAGNFGSETLVGLNNIAALFGLNVNFASDRILGFVHLGDMPSRTNIYTSFRRIVNDYGFAGVWFYQFSVGFLFSFLYQLIKKKRRFASGFWVLIYAYLAQYLVLSFADERLILNIFSATTLLHILLFFIFTRYCVLKST